MSETTGHSSALPAAAGGKPQDVDAVVAIADKQLARTRTAIKRNRALRNRLVTSQKEHG